MISIIVFSILASLIFFLMISLIVKRLKIVNEVEEPILG